MDVMDPLSIFSGDNELLRSLLLLLSAELREGLDKYWLAAGRILEGSGVKLHAPSEAYFSLKRNFFSALFLYSYFRSQIPRDHRMLYVAVNQCLRGMVTGCDNILDNEYKMTLDTDLPEGGTRFRSVLDIMVSDRVLVDLLLDFCLKTNRSPDLIRRAGTDSLQALTPSGIQEASEEKGIQERLTPEEVINRIHHAKTGLLFQCVWAVPAIIEEGIQSTMNAMKEALYQIGMGCQILDDMVDLVSDIRLRRHNYVASLIFHRGDAAAWEYLRNLPTAKSAEAFFSAFPQWAKSAFEPASRYLKNGLSQLFLEEHQELIPPSMAFITERIGANRLLTLPDGA
jgi:hypothetical protein